MARLPTASSQGNTGVCRLGGSKKENNIGVETQIRDYYFHSKTSERPHPPSIFNLKQSKHTFGHINVWWP